MSYFGNIFPTVPKFLLLSQELPWLYEKLLIVGDELGSTASISFLFFLCQNMTDVLDLFEVDLYLQYRKVIIPTVIIKGS